MLKIQHNIPLAPFTTFKIGGPAKFFCKVTSAPEIKEALEFAKEKNLPYFILGGGSNLLISDEGFPGLVIKNEMTGLRTQEDVLRACAGNQLQELVNFTTQHGLSGMHKLTGIYGTVGGAVFGNAGAYGQTISDYLTKVVALNPKTYQILELSKEQCEFGYRDSAFKKNGCKGASPQAPLIILKAHFNLPPAPGQKLQSEAQKLLGQRTAKFPFTLKCPGSFFKNISIEDISAQSLKLIPQDKITHNKIPAAVLLDLVGAKGQKVGNIQVSESHANLILNIGGGKASEVWQLAKDLITKVQETFNITLEPEVQFINLPPLF